MNTHTHCCELHADAPQLCMSPAAGVENWRPVPGWAGLYLVSDHGRVLSADRADPRGRWWDGRILRQALTSQGYPQVHLYRDGQEHARFVHRLVLAAFVGPAPAGHECRHLNGVRTDNRLDNLRWDTHSENMRDRARHGTFRNGNTDKGACPRGHALEYPNLIPSSVRQGHRSCLACSRARAHLRKHPELQGELQRVSDSYHRALLGD